jgi:superfamily II DNA or RNA helicase
MSLFGGPLFEELVNGGITMKQLTEQNFLVPMVAYGPNEHADLSKVKIVAGDYQEDQLAEAMNKPSLVGDVVKNWFTHAKDKQTMCFAVNIPHSQRICDEFVAMGVNAVHVDYSITQDQKTNIYREFKEGRITVLCNCALLSEGTDFPSAECLILARPTKSEVRYIQMIGRVLRPSPSTNKVFATVLDHGNCISRFGFPDDIVTLTLDDGKVKTGKEKKEKEEKEEPKPKECPVCKYLMRVGMKVCVGCGWTPKPKSAQIHTDEDLVEITRGNAKRLTKKAHLASTPGQEIYAQLKHHAESRGYKEGWAMYSYKTIFGRWPSQLEKSVIPMPPSGELLSFLRSEQIKKAKARHY